MIPVLCEPLLAEAWPSRLIWKQTVEFLPVDRRFVPLVCGFEQRPFELDWQWSANKRKELMHDGLF